MSGEMTVRTTSKAKALMKALNVSVSVLPLLPAQEDNSRRVSGTLMPIHHCHKPVFRPKMAILRRAGMREGGLPLPLAFQYLVV